MTDTCVLYVNHKKYINSNVNRFLFKVTRSNHEHKSKRVNPPQGAFYANKDHLQHRDNCFSSPPPPHLPHPHSLQLQMRSSLVLTRRLSASVSTQEC